VFLLQASFVSILHLLSSIESLLILNVKSVFLLIVWCGRRQAHSHSTINYDVELPHEGAIKEGQ
jgi:hypothetical protein